MIEIYLFIIAVVSFFVIVGAIKGMYSEVVSLWNLLAAMLITFAVFDLGLGWFKEELLMRFNYELVNDGMVFMGLFILAYIMLIFLSNKIFPQAKIKMVFAVDKIGGAAFGFIRGIFLASMLLIIGGMFYAEPISDAAVGRDVAVYIYKMPAAAYEKIIITLRPESDFNAKAFFDKYACFLMNEKEVKDKEAEAKEGA